MGELTFNKQDHCIFMKTVHTKSVYNTSFVNPVDYGTNVVFMFRGALLVFLKAGEDKVCGIPC